jgi:hypothetical protein
MDKPKEKWTLESCINEYLKYGSKKEFMINSSGAYQAAKKNKWLCKLNNKIIGDEDTKV